MSDYAIYDKQDDGSFSVKTPGRGFTLIKGLDEDTAYNVARCINKAYQNGADDLRRDLKMMLGVEDCHHDD